MSITTTTVNTIHSIAIAETGTSIGGQNFSNETTMNDLIAATVYIVDSAGEALKSFYNIGTSLFNLTE